MDFLEFLKTNKDALTIIVSTIIGFITLSTLIKAIVEYRLQGRQKRAEIFQKYDEMFEEENIKRIIEYLENDDPRLATLPKIDRQFFLSIYEQIAMAYYSKLIRKNVAHYMFGYYAVACKNSSHFWEGINKTGYYWSLFIGFASDMEKKQQQIINKSDLQLRFEKLTKRDKYKY